MATARCRLQLSTPKVLVPLVRHSVVCGSAQYVVRHRLGSLRADCSAALRTMRMPSNRQEEFRFTDLSPILKAQIQARLSTEDYTHHAFLPSLHSLFPV